MTLDSSFSEPGEARPSTASAAPVDVLIVGGGPAGSTVACLLARAGFSVRLLEKERFPRFHIGESLLPYNVPLFKRLGVWERMLEHGFQRKFGGQFVFEPGGETLRLDFQNSLDSDLPMALQVRRAELDHILLDNARQSGAEVQEEAQVEDVLFDEAGGARGVRARRQGETVDMEARVVIDATGRDTLLGHRLGLKTKDPQLGQAALYCHYRGADMGLGPEGGDILVVGGEYGWFWMIPLDTETTSVGVVFPSRVLKETRQDGCVRSPSEIFDRLVARSPQVSSRLRPAERARDVEGAADFSYRCDRFVGDGWMMVGDAAGFLDPVFSSGVLLAMRGAEHAADLLARRLKRPGPVTADQLRSYERFVRRGLDRFRRYILAYYDPGCVATFSEEPPALIRRAVSSAFAGKVFERDPRVLLMEALFFGRSAMWRRQASVGKVELPQAPACS